MLYLLIFLSALIFTIFFTPYLIKYLTKFGIVDHPGERRVHKKVTPRMGGVIIFAITLGSLLVYSPSLDSIKLLILGSLVIAACGIFDDILTLKYNIKFLLQGVAALLLLLFIMPGVQHVELFFVNIPQPLGYVLVFFFILGVINSINLLDGLDGLVSSFALIVSLIVLLYAVILQNTLLIIFCAALSGSILGFLKYNASPAKVFLGDTGSLVLGFFLVAICLITAKEVNPTTLDLTFPVILLSIPVLDTIKVMIIRLANKNNPFLPDRNHIHHILAASKIRHKVTVFIIAFFTSVYALISVYYLRYSRMTAVILFLVTSMTLVYFQVVLVKVRSIEGLKESVTTVLKIPGFMVTWFRRLFAPATLLVVGVFGISALPSKNILDSNVTLLTGCIFTLLLMVSFISRLQNKTINDFYVLLNIIFFILLSYASSPGDSDLVFIAGMGIKLQSICMGIIAFSIMAFLFLKEYIAPGKEGFLTGFDLTALVLIITFFVCGNIILSSEYSALGNHLLEAFILYLWYKVMIFLNKHYTLNLYYASFALPVLLFLFILLIG